MNDTRLFAIAGNPVLHSMSPVIFNAAFEAAGMNAVYIRLAMDGAGEAVRTIRDLDIAGTNITTPFKEDIIPYLDGLDDTARAIGAVNVVVNRKGILTGYNTDHKGVEETLGATGVDGGSRRKAVVVGAGGAARAAVFACIGRFTETVVLNRTPERARRVAARFGCRFGSLDALPDELAAADVVVLCVPDLDTANLSFVVESGSVVIDARYGKKAAPGTPRPRTVDGTSWLIAQAAESFRIFTGSAAPVGQMKKALGSDVRRKDMISLVGFMGAGKSTLGSALAQRLAVPLRDIDSRIELKMGMTITDIFRQSGEGAFRKEEKRQVKEALGERYGVLSVGGGAVMDEDTARLIKRSSHVVWLFAGLDETRVRAGSDASRPLMVEPDRVADLFARRIEAYARACDVLVRTDGPSVEDTVERIIYENYHTFGG